LFLTISLIVLSVFKIMLFELLIDVNVKFYLFLYQPYT